MTVTPTCVVTPRSTILATGRSTEVSLSLGAGCPLDEDVVVDLDGSGPVPEITVKAAAPSTAESAYVASYGAGAPGSSAMEYPTAVRGLTSPGDGSLARTSAML